MTTKRFLFTGVGAAALILAVLLFPFPGNPRYRADSRVLVKPYTNIFFGRSFEAQMVRNASGVLGLRVTPVFSGIPGRGVPVLTNGVGIRIRAGGATPQDAQRAANDAAWKLCQSVLTNYAVRGEIVDQATTAHRYSYFHDSFQPAVAKLFTRE